MRGIGATAHGGIGIGTNGGIIGGPTLAESIHATCATSLEIPVSYRNLFSADRQPGERYEAMLLRLYEAELNAWLARGEVATFEQICNVLCFG